MNYQNVKDELEQLKNQEYLDKMERFGIDNQIVLGVKVPQIRELVKSYLKSNKPEYAHIISFTDKAFHENIREMILFGLFILEKYKKHYDENFYALVDKWIDDIRNWEICDQLAKIFGFYFVKHIELDQKLMHWTSSENVWRRRFVMSAAVQLNQKGSQNETIPITLTRPLMFETEDLVKKAISWNLREVSKHNPDAVYQFLIEFVGKSDKKMIWEASEKLSPEWRRKLIP